MPITSTLRAGLSFAALAALAAAGVSPGSAPAAEPAIVAGCEPGTKFRTRAEFTWPTGVAKPTALSYGDFRCVIQDTATIDAYSLGKNASSALQTIFSYSTSGPLAFSSTTGLEESHRFYFYSSFAQGKPADRVSSDTSLYVKGKVANPVMKCFGRVSPSPDWFFAATIDLCAAPVDRFGAYDVKLYDLGTRNGNTFANSAVSTTPKGTIQPVAAFPQVFGKVYIQRTPAKTRCRKAGETFAWKFTARSWPSTVGSKPANFKYTGAICAMHTSKFIMWQTGRYASSALKAIAETGSTALMESLLTNNTAVMLWRKFDDFSSVSTQINVPIPANMPNYPLYSCIARMSPSPDWFVGASAKPMCGDHDVRTDISWLYDAGTDSGTTWTAANRPETVSRSVQSASSSSGHSGLYMYVIGGFPNSAAGVVGSAVVAVMLALSAL